MAELSYGGGPSVTIRGEAELRQALRELPKATAAKVVAVALMAGASPILQAARANAQTAFDKRTGSLAKSIRAVRRKGKSGEPYVVIGPAHGKKFFRRTKSGKLRGVSRKRGDLTQPGMMTVDPGYYAHLVEMGHKGKHGPAGAKPFLRPAFDAHKAAAERIIAERLKRGIEEEATKLAARSR